jgi:hypothetical protein
MQTPWHHVGLKPEYQATLAKISLDFGLLHPQGKPCSFVLHYKGKRDELRKRQRWHNIQLNFINVVSDYIKNIVQIIAMQKNNNSVEMVANPSYYQTVKMVF